MLLSWRRLFCCTSRGAETVGDRADTRAVCCPPWRRGDTFPYAKSKTKLVVTIPGRYRLESRQLRYFVVVARERNFTRAAEKLNIAQPPLSRQIQLLEEEVGVPLLLRNIRPVRLTDAGRLIFEQAIQILGRVEQMQAAARH